jgi:hypothetical protein
MTPLNKNTASSRALVLASSKPAVRLTHMDHIELLDVASFRYHLSNSARQLQ